MSELLAIDPTEDELATRCSRLNEELTDLKRRLHEAVDDVKEKCTMYDVDGANTALLILKKHLPELEE